MSNAFSVGLIIGVILGTILLCILVAILAICIRLRSERRRSSKPFLLPPPAHIQSLTASNHQYHHRHHYPPPHHIPPMPHIQSPSTAPSSPVESPVVHTASMFKLCNVNGSRSDISVVMRDESNITRPQSAVLRASPPLYPGHVPYLPLRVGEDIIISD